MEIAVVLIVLAPAFSLDPKSVNLDIETSVLFDPKDAKSNSSFLHSVKHFLDDLQQVLDPKPNYRARDDDPKFTDVIDEIAKALLNLTDNDIEKLCKTVYRKAKRLKMSDNDGFIVRNLKQNVKNTLKSWAKKPPGEIKNCIKLYLQHESGFFMDYIINKLNYVFEEEDIKNMKSKLNTITETNNFDDFNEIVGEVIDFAFNYNNKANNLIGDEIHKNNRNDDIIVAGRLKKELIENSGRIKVKAELNDDKRSTSKFKDREEIILNKNIEVFVRAAD